MGHFQHPCKCLSCGLHFVVLSWKEEWPDPKLCGAPVCPECGSDALLRWEPLALDQEIFMVVPGKQQLLGVPGTA